MSSLLNKFSQIYQGWKNHLVPSEGMKEFIEDLSKERLSKCITCPFNTTPGEVRNSSRCSLCGCWLIPKSKCPDCDCGAKEWNEKYPTLDQIDVRWEAVATGEQGIEIEKALNDEQSTQSSD